MKAGGGDCQRWRHRSWGKMSLCNSSGTGSPPLGCQGGGGPSGRGFKKRAGRPNPLTPRFVFPSTTPGMARRRDDCSASAEGFSTQTGAPLDPAGPLRNGPGCCAIPAAGGGCYKGTLSDPGFAEHHERRGFEHGSLEVSGSKGVQPQSGRHLETQLLQRSAQDLGDRDVAQFRERCAGEQVDGHARTHSSGTASTLNCVHLQNAHAASTRGCGPRPASASSRVSRSGISGLAAGARENGEHGEMVVKWAGGGGGKWGEMGGNGEW